MMRLRASNFFNVHFLIILKFRDCFIRRASSFHSFSPFISKNSFIVHQKSYIFPNSGNKTLINFLRSMQPYQSSGDKNWFKENINPRPPPLHKQNVKLPLQDNGKFWFVYYIENRLTCIWSCIRLCTKLMLFVDHQLDHSHPHLP